METEEQQLDEIRHWWSEHGRTVIAGVVLGLGTVIGWTSWRNYQESTAEELSARYDTIVNAATTTDYDQVRDLTNELIADHPKSSYAALSALVAAHAAYNSDDAATTERLLSWAIDNASSFDVANVARLRLAKVISQKGEFDRALTLLDAIDTEDFAALRLESRGDVLGAKSDLSAAEAAYAEALKEESLEQNARARIQLKLDELSSLGG
jgi:predicted negative regulator of RcsB-dependent stress response